MTDPRRAGVRFESVRPDDPARRFWAYHTDPSSVRRRGTFVIDANRTKFGSASAYPSGRSVRLLAMACGAAQPDLDSPQELEHLRSDLSFEFDLVDIDLAALSLAVFETCERFPGAVIEFVSPGVAGFLVNAGTQRTAQQSTPRDLRDEVVTSLFAQIKTPAGSRIRLFVGDIRDARLLRSLAGERGYDRTEATGLFDYTSLDPSSPMYAGRILHNMTAVLGEGGEALFAAMSTYHNLVQILGVVGWSRINPQSALEVVEYVEEVVPGALADGRASIGILENQSYLLCTVSAG